MTDRTYDMQPGNESEAHPMAKPTHQEPSQGPLDATDLSPTGAATLRELQAGGEGLTLGTVGRIAAAAGAALALYAGYRRFRSRSESPHGIRVNEVVTINRSQAELYRFWRNFENLPRFMKHLEAVHVLSDTVSRWKAKAPGGLTVEWDAEITYEKQPDVITWRSMANADIPNSGTVRFTPAPGQRGTEVHVYLEYHPPAGKLGQMFAKLFREEPEQQIAGDLRRFKQLMEAGELPTTEGQPHGVRSVTGKVAEWVFKQ